MKWQQFAYILLIGNKQGAEAWFVLDTPLSRFGRISLITIETNLLDH